MATGDRRSNLYSKKTLGLEALRDRVLEYAYAVMDDLAATVWGGAGWLAAVDLDITAADKITVTPASPGISPTGKHILLDELAAADLAALPFENANGVTYYVAFAFAEIPDGVETNPRTGKAAYADLLEYAGNLGTPDAVVDNGDGTLTLTVDTLTDPGGVPRSNAGRMIRVWTVADPVKNFPASAIESVAFEECTIAWTGGHNKITTVAAFGQTTPSTTAADYAVLLRGPLVSRNTNLAAASGFLYAGNVTGGGAGSPPSAKDLSGQIVFAPNGISGFYDAIDDAIEPLWQANDRTIGDCITFGGVVTAGIGLRAHFSLVDATIEGKAYRLAPGSIDVAFNTTSWIYIVPGTKVVATTTSYPMVVEDLLLAKVVATGSFIRAITDLRRIASDLAYRGPIFVGPSNDCHFGTITEAVAAVAEFLAHDLSSDGARTRTWEIVVQGDTTEPDTITMPVGGLTIRWVDSANAVTSWSGTKPLFELNGKNDLTFIAPKTRNFPGTIGATADAVAFVMSGSADVDRLRIIGGDHDANGGHGFFCNLGTGTLRSSRISGNRALRCRDFGIAVLAAERCWFTENEFYRIESSAPASILKSMIAVYNSDWMTISDNKIDGSDIAGIRLEEVDRSTIRGNTIRTTSGQFGIVITAPSAHSHLNVIDGNQIEIEETLVGATHIGIVAQGSSSRFVNNSIWIGDGGDATTSVYGIDAAVSGGGKDQTLIGNETILSSAGGIVPVGIRIGGPSPAGDRCIVTGNNARGTGISDLNGTTTVVANNVL